MEHEHLLAVAVGNTRTRLGLFHGVDLDQPASFDNAAGPEAVAAAAAKLLENSHNTPILLATVNPPAGLRIASALEPLGDVVRVGEDLGVPLVHALDDASTLGIDRQLCALAAYKRAEQAVIVIDAGTCLTVDFVDGEGVFQGGVIAPGLRMMLAAMHEKTASLPGFEFTPPDARRGVFGRDTRHAMTLGVLAAARGAARHAVDSFAEAYEAYPQIVATGGDAALLFENDGVVEHVVPDLQLIGILECWKAADRA